MTQVVLQTIPDGLLVDAAEVVGIAVLAAALAAVVALVYRWYTREAVPTVLAALFGLGAVAVYLNTTTALGQVAGGESAPLGLDTALVNTTAFLVGGFAATAGRRVGDHLGTSLFVATGGSEVHADVGRVVQAVGRVITVELPDDIDDIVGYDPVPDQTKDKLASRTFIFPRRLTVEELRNRLVTRLKADYAVGHVDMDLADDGTIEYIALGSRASGIGPTLPPETAAVAIRADPAHAASAGDLVQVWQTDPRQRVLTAEVRGVADDVVTLALDAADAPRLDPDREYKLVTLPVQTRPDREFASLLRAAEETMAAVTVANGSTLEGQPIGALDVAVVAARPDGGSIEPLPGRGYVIVGGDTLYVIARPEAIRRIETGAAAPEQPAPPPEPDPENLEDYQDTTPADADDEPETEQPTNEQAPEAERERDNPDDSEADKEAERDDSDAASTNEPREETAVPTEAGETPPTEVPESGSQNGTDQSTDELPPIELDSDTPVDTEQDVEPLPLDTADETPPDSVDDLEPLDLDSGENDPLTLDDEEAERDAQNPTIDEGADIDLGDADLDDGLAADEDERASED